MPSIISSRHALIGAGLLASHGWICQAHATPTVQVINGTYQGLYSAEYDQDFFLGMPFAQPPIGSLRYQVPQPLNSAWTDTHTATEYSPECIGYGSDQWVLGNHVSEDCLSINVIRPSGVRDGSNVPVAVWIYGGGFTEGGNSDPRYNLSFIVEQSVNMGQPMIGVSLNYRLAEWGFLFSQEILSAGVANLGLRDQRLALHWIQENIGAFGGDKSKVTIWGESAGSISVAVQLVAYGGRDDSLFRAGIQESGGAALGTRIPTLASSQPIYDAVVEATNCTGSTDTLACLRTIPTTTLTNIFNSSVTQGFSSSPVIDNDFLQSSGTTALRRGHFVKVPLLVGANHDEGTSFGTRGINTTQEFLEDIRSEGLDNATALTLAALYPDIPEIGIPGTLHGRPPPADASLGYMWKRAAAYGGDLAMHATRRMTTQIWAEYNQTAYSYHFNVEPNGPGYLIGATHFQEVAFVFDNINGIGYNNSVAVDPFENEPTTLPQLADIMSRMWISFITQLNPNENGGGSKHCSVLWTTAD
ncbi:MAG: hypothetical protein LQ340_004925 [Diploschistes diacapsis]|nr:MAG: hypothetical protein LQ340_004925 [Diploschistes diacapsis]